MSISVLYDRARGKAALCCESRDTAFGPCFKDEDHAECFLAWFRMFGPAPPPPAPPGSRPDPRLIPAGVLEALVERWRATPPCIDCDHPVGEDPIDRRCVHCASAQVRRQRQVRLAALLNASVSA